MPIMLATPLRRVKSVVRRLLYPHVHAPEVRRPYRVYGTEYGGWPLIDGSVGPDSLIVSVGLGEDISFDLEVIDLYGCTIHGCDPTPKSLAWLRGQSLPAQFHLHALGLGGRDGPLSFVPPANEAHVSFSAARGADQTSEAIQIDVLTMDSLMRRIGIARIDVLKMDIEGFEYGVIENIVGSALRPAQILVEFHHRMYNYHPDDTRRAIDCLHDAGYRIFYVSESGHEYGLVHVPADNRS